MSASSPTTIACKLALRPWISMTTASVMYTISSEPSANSARAFPTRRNPNCRTTSIGSVGMTAPVSTRASAVYVHTRSGFSSPLANIPSSTAFVSFNCALTSPIGVAPSGSSFVSTGRTASCLTFTVIAHSFRLRSPLRRGRPSRFAQLLFQPRHRRLDVFQLARDRA